ncbi:MAG: reverse transcriptase family protein, partial [Pseudomonadota bacterium]
LSLFPDDKLVIAGDFNDFPTRFLSENFNLVNCVTVPTRKDAILDNVWIDDRLSSFYPVSADVGPPLQNSDHNCIFLRSLCSLPLHEDRRATLVWDFRHSNICEYLRRLSLVDFEIITKENTVNDMCAKFYDLLSECLSAVPCETVYFSSRDKPWMTPILKLMIDKRWKAFRERNWSAYKHYKAKVSIEIKNAKRIWCEKNSKSPRGLWSVVSSLRGAQTKDTWQRLVLDNGDMKTFLERLTAEFCSNYNADVDVDLLPLNDVEWDFFVTPESISLHLSHLNLRKAVGPDQIPPLLLKVGAQFLCRPLAEIFNSSISNRIFPILFKHANVCPIPKSSRPTLRDFRPISLLPVISKIFETLILDHTKGKLFSCYGKNQHAYRPLGSTTSALIELCEYVTESLDYKQTCVVNMFCLDLSKAFDKLHHHRLINFLSGCGFNHGFLRWLYSYLSSRTFCVKVMNTFGSTVASPSGVPQGSVLGPFLFAAFMGSIKFPFKNVKCVKYADDVTIIEALCQNEISSISLDYCESVFREQGLFVNRSKCKQMCLRRSRVPYSSHVLSGFSEVTSMRILGVIFSDSFKWDDQISQILKSASKRLYLIRRLKDYLCNKDLTRVYHCIITSLFLYASPVYGHLPSSLLSKLEKFQKRAHRLIC